MLMTEHDIRKLFPNASASLFRVNKAIDVDNKAEADDGRGMEIVAPMLWEEYLRTGSIHRACLKFGVSGETARKYLRLAGYRLDRSKWTSEELGTLKLAYASNDGFDISTLSRKLSRTHAAVACKANELGICCERGKQVRTETARENLRAGRRSRYVNSGGLEREKQLAERRALRKILGHPRGMLGKKHTEETKQKMGASQAGKKRSPESVAKQMQSRLLKYGTLAPSNGNGRSWKAGWREIGGVKIYARSSWESNYARYLEWLRQNGSIKGWEHEPVTFWFEKIRRGCRSYLPDFRVTENNGSIAFHEVKGWMDARSITKFKRMKKYHPTVQIIIRDKTWFKANNPMFRGLISGWESPR